MKTRAACFSDIHWGRKNNSELHNQDCVRYIDWFCEEVKKDGEIDHIVFMGDWFEHRSAINGLTLDYAYKGARKIQELDIPVYFIVGNHDLYYRTTRDVYSTNFFDSLGFNLISTPQIVSDIGKGGALMCPYLFEEEYSSLAQYFNIPIWFGHFEFKGFIITGDTVMKEHGPNPDDYTKPKRIFSGHYHKRQWDRNITYIGNTFPVDFSDANDITRGMMIYEYGLDDAIFINWPDCPSYIRTTLTEVIKNPKILTKDATVNCLVDKEITYEQSIKLREQLTTRYKLREITLQESSDQMDALEGTNVDDNELDHLDTTDALVKTMLSKIKVESIDTDRLIKIYEGLK